MRCLFTLLASFIIFVAQAQNTRPNTFRHHELQVGIGGWASVLNTNLAIRDSRASGSIAALEYRYYHNSPLGIGMILETSKINIDDDDDTTLKSASGQFLNLGLSCRYHLVNKSRFQLFLGTAHMVSKFAYERINRNEIKSELNAKGFQHTINIGFNWYFTKMVGLFGDLRWQIQSVRIVQYTHDGTETEYLGYLPAKDVFFNFRGTGMRIGISLRF